MGEGVSPRDRTDLQRKGKDTTDAEEVAPAVVADIVLRYRYEPHPEGSMDTAPMDAPAQGATLAETHGLHLQESLGC